MIPTNARLQSKSAGVLATPLVLVGALAIGFWPVWRWYVARMSDGSDEPLGLFALVAVAVFLPRRGWLTGVPLPRLVTTVAVLVLYLGACGFVPPLIRAGVAMTALVFVLPRDESRTTLPLFALLILSLPVIATLQYFLGYPVRAATTWCSAHLLQLAGLAVESHGTVLRWNSQEILIDAPCSGVRMLWIAACLSSVLAAAYRLTARHFLRLAQITSVIVFIANLGRSTVLFLVETNIWPNPRGAHDAVGIAVFALVAAVCVITAERLRARKNALA